MKVDGEAECSVGVGTWFIRYPLIQARILHKLVQVGRLSVFSGVRLHHRSVCKCMFQVRQDTGRPTSRAPLAGLRHWAPAPAHPQSQLVPKTSRSLRLPQGHWRHFPQIHQELEVARSFPGYESAAPSPPSRQTQLQSAPGRPLQATLSLGLSPFAVCFSTPTSTTLGALNLFIFWRVIF